MARTKSIDVLRHIEEQLPASEIRSLAGATGAFERRRKVDPVHLVWAVTLGFSSGPTRTIAGIRRAYETVSGESIAPSSFYDRFTPQFAELLSRLAGVAIERTGRVTSPAVLSKACSKLGGIFVTDSTLVRLRALLEEDYPGSRTNHSKAAMKLHAVMNATGWGTSVRITSGRSPDVHALRIGSWIRNKLLLFDCAYYSYALLEAIRLHGGYFAIRLPAHIDPTIRSVARGASAFEGQRLRSALGQFTGSVLDVDAHAKYRHNKRRRRVGARKGGVFRFVAVRDQETGELWHYATNLPREEFSAEAVAAIYQARWIVELLFKSLKNDLNLDQLPSTNKAVVDTLVYASLIAWTISNGLRETIAARAHEPRRITPQRWTRLIHELAPLLLHVVTAPRSALARLLVPCIERTLRIECRDPHRARASTLERAQVPKVPGRKRRVSGAA